MSVKCSNCGTEHADWVPGERLEKVSEQRRQEKEAREKAETDLAAARKEWETSSKATTEKLSAFDANAKSLADLQAAQQSWQTERAIMSAGILDPEGIDFARVAWDRLPADGRPASVGEWLAGDKVPKAVRAYMPQADAGSQQQAHGATQQRAAAPPANAGTKVTPPPSAPPGAADIMGMSDADYRAQRSSLFASVGAAPPKQG